MVEFLSLFLGLVVGTQPVTVSAGPGVAGIEVTLDSEPCGTVNAVPWQLECDFGLRLAPHRLRAIARDAEGEEVGRTEQWINLPRPRSEAALSLVGETAGAPRRAQLVWESLDFDQPRAVQVLFDGVELALEDGWIELPAYDSDEFHILSAELEFSDTVSVRANAVFGGDFGERVSTELTSVVIENRKRRPPAIADLQGALLGDGRPLRVVALERGGFDLIVVREQSAGLFEALQRLIVTGSGNLLATRARLPKVLTPADRVRFAFPTAAASQGQGNIFELVPVSDDVSRSEDRTLDQIITALDFPAYQESLPAQRLADAVAIAGVVAAQGNRRRIVVLLTSDESTDISRLSAATTRDYLNSLMVPLMVWKLQPPGTKGDGKPSNWGAKGHVSDWGRYTAAYRKLSESLDRQSVVWVEGRHLPQSITLAPHIKNFSLARRADPALASELENLALTPEPTPEPSDTSARSQDPPDDEPLEGQPIELFDSRRLEQAASFLRQPATTHRLGQLTLLTDLSAPRLMKGLARVADQIPTLYQSQYGLSSDLAVGGAIALFSEEDQYRAYQRALGTAATELVAHASTGLIALFAGDQAQSAIEATLTHELVHLLNMRAFGSDLVPWLEEGLAGAMSLATLRRGKIVIEPMEPERPITRERRLEGLLALLPDLADQAAEDRLPRLAELATLDDRRLANADNARRLYALSALWVHYLANIDRATRETFHRYLAAVASEPSRGVEDIAGYFNESGDDLERRFRDWLRELAIVTAP